MNNAKCKIKNAKWKMRSLLFVFHFAFYLFNFALFPSSVVRITFYNSCLDAVLAQPN